MGLQGGELRRRNCKNWFAVWVTVGNGLCSQPKSASFDVKPSVVPDLKFNGAALRQRLIPRGMEMGTSPYSQLS